MELTEEEKEIKNLLYDIATNYSNEQDGINSMGFEMNNLAIFISKKLKEQRVEFLKDLKELKSEYTNALGLSHPIISNEEDYKKSFETLIAIFSFKELEIVLRLAGLHDSQITKICELIEANFVEKEEIRKIYNKYLECQEIIKNGQRFLVIDGVEIPFGYPFPDTREKYIIEELKQKLLN